MICAELPCNHAREVQAFDRPSEILTSKAILKHSAVNPKGLSMLWELLSGVDDTEAKIGETAAPQHSCKEAWLGR